MHLETTAEPSTEPNVVVPYSSEWPKRFQDLASAIRRELGDAAIRIDHIGSTAIPSLAARPVIDIQVSVSSFEPFAAIQQPLERIGYRWRANNPDRTKRYFREAPGAPRTHIHVRRIGSWSEQFALLFRDYLRSHPAMATDDAALKRELADRFRVQRQRYTDAKDPFIWQVMREASEWSHETGWGPGQSDA